MNEKLYLNAFTTHDSVLGCIIKIVRLHRKIKQKPFADMIGLSVSSISKIERGEYCFGFDFVVKACQSLNLELGRLFVAYDTITGFMLEQGIVIHNVAMPKAGVIQQDAAMQSAEAFLMPMSGRLLQQYISNSKTMSEALADMLQAK